MKKFFALLICAVMLFSFTACLAAPESENSGKSKTNAKNDEEEISEKNDELPLSGVTDVYKFDEYSDHVVLTEYIGDSAKVEIPDKINDKPVTEFGTIFCGNLNIKSVLIGKYCTEIVDIAFKNCYNLQSVEIVSGVRSIGNDAFYGCHSLEIMYMPSCVEKIADDAFSYITGLTVIGDKGSKAESFAEIYESIYFLEYDEVNSESTNVLVGEDYTEEIL